MIHVRLLKTNKKDQFGKQDQNGPSVFDIQELFTQFGDINIVKDTAHSCYIEFHDIDWDILNMKAESNFAKTKSTKRGAHKTAKNDSIII